MSQLIMSLALGVLLVSGSALDAQEPDVVRMGLVDSLVKDLSPAKRKIIESDFPDMVKDFTGVKSQVFQGGDPLAAGKKLADGAWHLATMHGVEFAWAQAKDPKLQPLMVAVGRLQPIHALLIVKNDSKFTAFADLEDQKVHLLSGRLHCQLFHEKNAGGKAATNNSKLQPISSTENALDNILRGQVQAAVVDNAALENYQALKPGGFARLKVLAKSEPFPSTVIAYRPGVLTDQTLNKFRDGLLKANQTESGREAMAYFQVTAFMAVPADYAKQLSDILKVYPGPGK